MSRFEDRIGQGFDRFADHATPSPTTWEAFRTRIDEEADQPEVEIIMLSDQTPNSRRHPRRWILAAAATLVAALAVGLLIARTPSDQDAPAVDPTPTDAIDTDPDTTTSTSTTTTTTTTTTAPQPAAEIWSMDAVPPGTFATALFEPGFTVDVLEGWTPFQPESRNQWNIGIPEDHLLNVNAVTAETPSDVVAGATAGGLELSDSEDVEVGGVPAQRYDVVGGEGYMFETEFAEFGMDSTTDSGRLTLLEVGGRVIAIVELVPLDTVEESRAATQRIIDSIEWSAEPSAG